MTCKLTAYDVQNRLAEQFKNKPLINGFLEAFVDRELESAECDLLTKRWLNTAVGKQLDGIGEIVGKSRPYLPLDETNFFGFEEDLDALGFTTLTNLEVGGFQAQLNPPLATLANDDIYRILIKAKIFQNSSSMTVDETLNILSAIFDTKIRYFLPTNLYPMYEINKSFYSFEESIIKDLPQTIGIGEVQYKVSPKDSGFGFAEDPNALGFTTLSDNSIGGNFAKFL